MITLSGPGVVPIDFHLAFDIYLDAFLDIWIN